jgi:hypothetical protein
MKSLALGFGLVTSVLVPTALADPLVLHTSGELPFTADDLEGALATRTAVTSSAPSTRAMDVGVDGHGSYVYITMPSRTRTLDLDGASGVDAARLVAFAILDLATPQLALPPSGSPTSPPQTDTGVAAERPVERARPITPLAGAWVNPKGTLATSITSDVRSSDGIWSGSVLVHGLPVNAYDEQVAASYVPVEHLAVTAALDGTVMQYSGPQMIPGFPFPLTHGSQDDGQPHGNLTDLELGARYQLYDRAFTLTPLVHGRVPITDYEQKGYAAAGTHLAELGVGAYVGKRVDRLVLQGDYTFTYVEKEDGGGMATEQYRTNRSDVSVSASYLYGDRWTFGVGGSLRWTHDGFDLDTYSSLPAGSPLLLWCDPVLKARYLAPAAFVSYQPGPWILSLRASEAVWGQNTTNAMTVGFTLGYLHDLFGRT